MEWFAKSGPKWANQPFNECFVSFFFNLEPGHGLHCIVRDVEVGNGVVGVVAGVVVGSSFSIEGVYQV